MPFLVGKAGFEPTRRICKFLPRERPLCLPRAYVSPFHHCPIFQTDKNHNRDFTLLYRLSYPPYIWTREQDSNLRHTAPKAKYLLCTMPFVCYLLAQLYFTDFMRVFNSHNRQIIFSFLWNF